MKVPPAVAHGTYAVELVDAPAYSPGARVRVHTSAAGWMSGSIVEVAIERRRPRLLVRLDNMVNLIWLVPKVRRG